MIGDTTIIIICLLLVNTHSVTSVFDKAIRKPFKFNVIDISKCNFMRVILLFGSHAIYPSVSE